MNCLPIVARELRVAARKRSTFWLRIIAAACSLLLGLVVLIICAQTHTPASQVGTLVFHLLTWTCLAFGLFAGLFLTADCLSEEKRDGTLGLLFLTELHGYDVAVGKLLATSLRGIYALLAVFPVLAITLLFGGITGLQFGKASLALIDGLFLSLAIGLLISALSRDAQKALAGTLFVVLLLAIGGPLADIIIASAKKVAFVPRWSLTSPGFALACASARGRSPYWTALLLTQGLTWLMFGLACGLVSHTWQERRTTGARSTVGAMYLLRYGSASGRRRRRRKLLEARPIVWLATRERWQPLFLWLMALLLAGGLVVVLISKTSRELWLPWMYFGGLFMLVLYIGGTSQACSFFPAVRRSGMLELLLVTPVGATQLVRGQWQASCRQFGIPLLLLIGIHVTASALSQLSFQHMITATPRATAATPTNQIAAGTNQNSGSGTVVYYSSVPGTNGASAWPPLPPSVRRQHAVIAGITAGSAGLRAVANLLALFWFGLWMGLTSRTANLATGKTLLFVQVIPWFVITFGATILLGMVFFQTGRSGSANPVTWWPVANSIITTILSLLKDIGFITWSKQKLRSSLCEQAGRTHGQPRLASPSPLPPPIPARPPLPLA